MAIYNSGGNDYNWGMDWTPVSQTFLGIGDLLNKKKRLAYEMGDYQGGNPQYAGSLKDTIQKVTSAAGGNPYSAVGTQSGIGGDTLFARGEQAGLNAALAYDKKNPQKISGVDLFLAEGGGGINKMGNVSTDQFVEQAQNRALARQAAADTAKQKMDSSWSVDVKGGKAQLGGEYFGQAYMNPETGKKEWVRPLAETLKSAEQEMAGAPQKKAQQIQRRVADEIRTNIRNGYKYKGADFRQSQEILLNDTLARLAQTNNPREYLNTVMKYIQDVKVANVGMHPDHQIKTNELRDYLLAGMPRPAGGPGLKTWQVPRSINGTVVNFTVSAADPKSAIREAEAEAMRQYNTKGLGTTAVPASAGYDPSLKYAAAGNEAMKRAIEGNASPDTLRNISESTMTSVRNTPMGGSRSDVYQMNNDVGGFGIGINLVPSVDIKTAANETDEQRRKRILGR